MKPVKTEDIITDLLYISAYKTEVFPFQNNPKNLDLS